MVPPLVNEADRVLQIWFEIALEVERFIVSVNKRLANLDEVVEHGQVNYELDGNRDHERPVEDRSWRFLFI